MLPLADSLSYTTYSPDHFQCDNSSSFRGWNRFDPVLSSWWLCKFSLDYFLNLKQTPLSKKTHWEHTFPGSTTIIDFHLNLPTKYHQKWVKCSSSFCVKCDDVIYVLQIAAFIEKVMPGKYCLIICIWPQSLTAAKDYLLIFLHSYLQLYLQLHHQYHHHCHCHHLHYHHRHDIPLGLRLVAIDFIQKPPFQPKILWLRLKNRKQEDETEKWRKDLVTRYQILLNCAQVLLWLPDFHIWPNSNSYLIQQPTSPFQPKLWLKETETENSKKWRSGDDFETISTIFVIWMERKKQNIPHCIKRLRSVLIRADCGSPCIVVCNLGTSIQVKER